jgi:hypothetical protein
MGKGANWERNLARLFSKWLTGRATPPVLWRSTQSGGWKHRGASNAGDLSANGEEGQALIDQWVIEAKHWNKIDFWHVFSRPETSDLVKWWIKVSQEAVELEKLPMLIVKRDYYPPLIGIPGELCEIEGHSIRVSGLNCVHSSVTFYELDKFFDQIKPELFLGY